MKQMEITENLWKTMQKPFKSQINEYLRTNLYPKVVTAVLSSPLLIAPDLSLSKDWKHCCQSVTYFHNDPNSSKLIVPFPVLSNIPGNRMALLELNTTLEELWILAEFVVNKIFCKIFKYG